LWKARVNVRSLTRSFLMVDLIRSQTKYVIALVFTHAHILYPRNNLFSNGFFFHDYKK
jgi:hypothetical protein